jgi:signal transduction histidine kinase
VNGERAEAEEVMSVRTARIDMRAVRTMLLVAAGYYCAARLGFAFTFQPDPISTLWPPNALLMAVLLLAPARSWWKLLAAALPAHLLVELQSGLPLVMVLGWYLSNCSEALIGAGLVRAFVPGPLRFDSLRSAGAFILGGGLAAPLLSSFLDPGPMLAGAFGDDSYWRLVRVRFFSNVIAALTVVPLIVTWASCGLAPLRNAPASRYAEAAVMFTGLVATSLLVFDVNHGAASAAALFYAPLPFLLWAAVRFGPAGTASALAAMTVAAIWGVVHGLGPFTAAAPEDTVRNMQLFLVSVAVPLLLLAVALEERSAAELEAHEQRLQLTHLSRVAMLGELSGGLAHELNQPLTAILANAQAAQHFIASRNVDPAELSEILKDIISADQRAGDVIRRLRALFKRGEALVEQLDANDLVRETLIIVHGDLVTRGIELVPQLARTLPPIEGDRVQLEQVMLNLIVNACEAMSANPAGSRRLGIRTELAGDRVQISFADGGPGWRPEEYEKMFQPFYTTKPQGLGLGLSISRTIIVAHGGRLWGVSTPGRGATFHIALSACR